MMGRRERKQRRAGKAQRQGDELLDRHRRRLADLEDQVGSETELAGVGAAKAAKTCFVWAWVILGLTLLGNLSSSGTVLENAVENAAVLVVMVVLFVSTAVLRALAAILHKMSLSSVPSSEQPTSS